MKEKMLDKIYDSKRNLIIYGDMSTGKTSNINYPMVEKMIQNKESFLILDSKKEYINKYYDGLKKENYNVVIVNLSDVNKSEGFNPLEYPYGLYKENHMDEAIKIVEQISQELFNDENSSDPFWANSARDFFIGIVLGLYEDAKEIEINLVSVNSLISESEQNLNDFMQYFRLKDKNNTAYVCASGTVFAPEETKGGIISFTKQKLRPFIDRKYLNLLLSKTTFHLNDLLNKKNAIFLICEEEDKEITPLVSIFIKQIYLYLSKSILRSTFHFILDNFDIIEYFPNLKEILSSCISKNIKFILTTRDKEQFEKKYSTYINKVSNQVEVDEQNIFIKINNKTVSIRNKMNENVSYDIDIDYPMLQNKNLNIFDLRNYLLNHEKEKTKNSQNTNKNNALKI